MSIQATNNNARIDWSSLLNKLDAASKAVETQGAGGVTAGSSVTITANVDGVEKAITFPVPDDLDLPAAVDQAGIDSLCAKLAGNQSLGLTEADVKAVHDALSAALAAAAPSLSETASTGSKSVMFDLYKLMALLVEVGQKQRDAAREMREAESAQIQKAIQNQADQQKAAALTGMIAGAICCAIQVAVSVGMLAKQGSAFKQQIKTLGTSGVDAAKQNLSMVKAAESPDAAKTQLDNVKAQIGSKAVPGQHRTLGAEVEHSFETADQAQARLGAAKAQLTADGEKLQRIADPAAQRQPGDVPADSKLAKAEAELAKFDRFTELDAKEDLTEAEAKEIVTELKGFAGRSRAEFTREVEVGRAELVSEMQSKIVADGDKVETARQTYREAIKTDLGRYENEYQAALSERSLATNATKAEIQRLDANVSAAADKLQYARAFANDKLAQPGVTTAAERAADIKLAADQIDSAMHSRSLDSAFLRASFQLQTTEVKLGIVNAIGNATQSFISGLTSYIQAGAKEGEAQQNKAQEELDQTKDLFNQAQELVDAVVQLMQAVTSAESQSMRDAIQA